MWLSMRVRGDENFITLVPLAGTRIPNRIYMSISIKLRGFEFKMFK